MEENNEPIGCQSNPLQHVPGFLSKLDTHSSTDHHLRPQLPLALHNAGPDLKFVDCSVPTFAFYGLAGHQTKQAEQA